MFNSIKVGVTVKVTSGSFAGEVGKVTGENKMGNVWPWIVTVETKEMRERRTLAFAESELKVIR